jgi:hypothetical protein
MKKSLTVLFACCLFLAPSLQAQEDSTLAQHPDSAAATGPYRNEIGINVAPLALIALGATPYSQPPLGLTYKRVYGKWAWRLNFTLGADRNRYPSQVLSADSIYRSRELSFSRVSYTGRIGLEYRRSLRTGWYFVGGVDLQARQLNSHNTIEESEFRIDSVTGKGTASEYLHLTPMGTVKIYDDKVIYQQVGLGLTAGLMYAIADRWWILGHLRLDTFYGPGRREETDHLTGKKTKSSFSVFDLDTGPAISELLLVFRF